MKIQKRLAAQILKTSPRKVRFDEERLDEIDEAITKQDVRMLIKDKAITRLQDKGISKGRSKKLKEQKSKGRRKGAGSRKGKSTARLPRKQEWMNNIRRQRKLLKKLKETDRLTNQTYRDLYNKSKGGFFRNSRHIKLYIKENELIQDGKDN